MKDITIADFNTIPHKFISDYIKANLGGDNAIIALRQAHYDSRVNTAKAWMSVNEFNELNQESVLKLMNKVTIGTFSHLREPLVVKLTKDPRGVMEWQYMACGDWHPCSNTPQYILRDFVMPE